MNLLKLLRDPIWQMLGVIVGLVTLVLTAPQLNISNGELVVLPVRKSPVVDRWMAKDSLKLLIDGSSVDSKSAVATSYLFINESGSPIPSEYFNGPIRIQAARGTRIVRVDSCATSFGQACTADGTRTASGGAFVDTSWKKDGDSWVAPGPLLNKDDVACVQIVIESIEPGGNNPKAPKISAHIKGVNLRYFATAEEYGESRKKWHNSLQTSVQLEGYEPHFVALIAAVLMFASARLFVYGFAIPIGSATGASLLVVLMLLCVSTAEILVSLYLKTSISEPHPIVGPLLGIHALAVISLAWRAFNLRNEDVKNRAVTF